MKLTEEMQERLMFVRICKACRMLKQDVVVWKKKRCPLCGSLTKKFELKAGKKDKHARFPRELNPKDPLQAKIIQMIEEKTRDFDCPGIVSCVTKGPVVTEFEFVPDKFTRIKKLKSLNEDLAMALEADTVTIRRIPKKSALGISVPNAERKEVTFEDGLKNALEHRYDMELPINFGVTSDGTPYVEDLANFPHLLMAGSTGTGKSVWLHNIITSLLYMRSKKELRLMLVDPKTVELFKYRGMPHLLKEPVNSVWGCLDVMEELIQEMKRRTANLHVLNAQNIKELNDRIKAEAAALKESASKVKDGAARKALEEAVEKKLDECWPYIILVIDEMAEIVLEEKKEFIMRLASIAQMARAAGICVIAATQRPSVDVLPGKVKCNFLGRASLRVPAPQDSKTVLNFKGAESLIGKGDAFVLSPDKTGLQRVHIPYCKVSHIEEMKRMSLEYGHERTCPADFLPKKAEEDKAAPVKGGK